MSFPPLRLREALTLGGLTPGELVRRTWTALNEHEIVTRAAAVSFYATLALVPFVALVMTLTVARLPDVRGLTRPDVTPTAEQARFRSILQEIFPGEASVLVEEQVARLQDQARPSPLLVVAGLLVTVWLASSLFVAIIDAMNRISGVTETRSFLRIRLTAIVMTCVQALILAGSLLIIVFWPQILRLAGFSVTAALFATAVQWLVLAVMVLLSFALTFYVGPDADQRWEWITPGSIGGTLIFLIASFGFRVYVQHFADYDKTYGSLGGVMVLVFWFWISSLVLLTSAQMNRVIEAASPLGKPYGQKHDSSEALDLKAIEPEPSPK